MGEVYQAHDLKLNRQVALKILPDSFAHDRERLARFDREAKLLASLNHPNIAAIYGLEEARDKKFLVLELVEGETLAQRIKKGPLPLEEAVKLCRQIAEGLETAHEKGVVHRDLKPANVMIAGDDKIKILDFGLAKVLAAESAATAATQSPTVTEAMTGPGVILGTAAYMSPEQANGKAVDKRADIWAFGCVLYECLTGGRAFPGDTVSETIVSILGREPGWDALPATTPPAIRKLLERCLRKNPRERIHDVSDVRIEIQEALNESADVVHVQERGLRGRLLMSLAVVVVILAVAGVWYLRREPRQEAPLKVVPLTSYIGTQRQPSLSPDGRELAFSWDGEKQDNFDIYVQMVSGGTPQRLTMDPAPDLVPVWSPDANQIAFLRENSVYLISPRGGAERRLCSGSGWIAWSPDGRSIATSDRDSEIERFAIFMVSVETGKKQRMTTLPAKFRVDSTCVFSPDGRNMVFRRQPSALGNDAYILPLANGAPKGEPWRLTNDGSTIYGFAWTPDSREIVFSSDRGGRRSLWRIIPAPGAEPQRIPGADDGRNPSISKGPPTRLAYQRLYQDTNIWRMEIPHSANINNSPTQIIASSAPERDPQFSFDGRRVAFTSERSGYSEIWLAAGDGSNPTQLTSFAGSRTAGASSWSPNGRQIVFDSMVGGYLDIFVLNLENRVSRQLTDDHGFNARPSWSRDGHWIYFGSNRSGTHQVWKMSPDGGNPRQLTKDGGFEAVEAPNGKELYYTKTWNEAPGLWRMPLKGGRETPVIEAVRSGHWAVTDQGIYFLDFGAVPAAAPKPLLKFFSFETQKVSQHGTIEKIRISSDASFSVSRDGRSVIWSQLDRSESNIMLIDKFR